MKPSQRSATSSPKRTAGPIAMLGGSLRAGGSVMRPAPRVRLALASILAAIAVVCFAPSSALAAIAHEYKSSFGPNCTEATQFVWTGAIAVDESTHDVYVADLGQPSSGPAVRAVYRCTANGEEADFTAGPGAGTNHISGFAFLQSQGSSQIAVSPTSHDFYVVDQEASVVKAFAQDGEEAKFTAGPGVGTNELSGILPSGVAVDASGDIYVASAYGGPAFSGAVAIYAPDGEELTSFETTHPANLAVDSRGAVYVDHSTTQTVEKLTPSAFPVTSATTYPATGVFVDGGPDLSIALDPTNDDLYFDQSPKSYHSQLMQRDGDGNLLGTFAAPGEPGELGESEGLAIDGSTGVVYAANATTEPKSDQRFQVRVFAPATPHSPSVGRSASTTVTATSASLEAQVNPEHFDTHYRFQYLTEAVYKANGETFAGAAETPEADLGSSAVEKPARASLSGLAPDTTYVFRVVAENANDKGSPAGSAVVLGEEGVFHTDPATPVGLPDGRMYEMVSPPAKAGEVFTPSLNNNPQLGNTCEEMQRPSYECFPGADDVLSPMQSTPDGEAMVFEGYPFGAGTSSTPNEYLAKRAAGGWVTQSLSTPLFISESGAGQGYKAFSSDFSESVVYQVSPALSPETPTFGGKSYADLYLRHADGTLQPLVTKAPPNRTPGQSCETTCEEFNVAFGGGNAGTPSAPAFSHLVFAANDALTGATASAPAAVDGGAQIEAYNRPSNLNLYEWFGGGLRLVNVLPGNATTAPGAVLGSGILLAPKERAIADVDHAISDDGSHIFWSEEATGQVYVRIDGDETVRVEDPGKFLTATSDGSKVLLSDGCLYDLASKSCEADLSQGHGAPTFEGILGAAEDLSRVYFVDREALTPSGEENANGEHAITGEYNLYAWHRGTTTFIGALLNSDNTLGEPDQFGDWKPSSTARVAQVTPDGTQLAFMSTARLTGYDNTVRTGASCGSVYSASSLSGFTTSCSEVFEYDANTGKLSCASCNPAGLRPLGHSNLSLIAARDVGLAASEYPPLPQPHNLSPDGEGRLFFESEDQLSPRDINTRTDVYEWEPSGVGSCDRASGCVFLISDGQSETDSAFVDSSDTGGDAFFVTRSQLLPQDTDQLLDLYDARIGGGIKESTLAPCTGEGCKSTSPTSVGASSPSSGSAAFSGPGNPAPAIAGKPAEVVKPKASLSRAQKLAKALKACAKRPRAKRQACRAQARKRYGPVMEKKPSGSKSNAKGSK